VILEVGHGFEVTGEVGDGDDADEDRRATMEDCGRSADESMIVTLYRGGRAFRCQFSRLRIWLRQRGRCRKFMIERSSLVAVETTSWPRFGPESCLCGSIAAADSEVHS